MCDELPNRKETVLVFIRYIGNKDTSAVYPKSMRVNRRNVIEALLWLKKHNPHYRDVTINKSNLDWMKDKDEANIGQEGEMQTKRTHYVVVYGFFGKAWALKASFLQSYLHIIAGKMNSMKGSKVDLNHCHSYYEINTRKHEFGSESVWRRLAPKNGKSGNTIKRMSFVLSLDTVHNNLGIDKVKDASELFLFSMKKCETNQVG